MELTSAERAAADLLPLVGSVKSGSLRVFGDWFGRPFDNIHTVRSVHADGETLVVGFDGHETLRVTSPADWQFSEHVFCIRHARRVVWSWYAYGRKRKPKNLFTIEHEVDPHGTIHASSDVDWYEPTFAPTDAHAAVELLD